MARSNTIRYIAALFGLIVATSVLPEERGMFFAGEIGIGGYFTGVGRPEITTPNGIGSVAAKWGYGFNDNLDVYVEAEHWSSLQEFPNVFSNDREHGYGFNAIWVKAEKRFYVD